MQLTDLRRISSRKLLPLFEEEVEHWLEELHWDYRASQNLIRTFIDAHTLAGYVALVEGQPAGYGFYVLEERKGLLGGLFVSTRYDQAGISRALLHEMIACLRAIPGLGRIEGQLMPFGTLYDAALVAEGFQLYPREFMLLDLGAPRPVPYGTGPRPVPYGTEPRPAAPCSPAFQLHRWHERFFQPCARLIRLAYTGHIDAEINDQYCAEAGAAKFLRNIILLRGCGEFLPEASFVLFARESGQPAGMVLTSAVCSGVGHTTQICFLPRYQHLGLGGQLMEASIAALGEKGFRALSLTVTSANLPAVRLYRRLGFRTLKTFPAAVWRG
jgi:ribosomal protein S18 acetylase RimI-like enzyme